MTWKIVSTANTEPPVAFPPPTRCEPHFTCLDVTMESHLTPTLRWTVYDFTVLEFEIIFFVPAMDTIFGATR